MWTMITFLKRTELLFNTAINSTPTGEVRNAFTALNMERMLLIQNADKIESYAIKLHEVLNKIVETEKEIADLSSDDSRLGDASYERDQLVSQLVKIMQE